MLCFNKIKFWDSIYKVFKMKKLLNRFQTRFSKFLYQFAFTKNDRRAIGMLSGLIAVSIVLRTYGFVQPAREWLGETPSLQSGIRYDFNTHPHKTQQTPKTNGIKMNKEKNNSTNHRKDSMEKRNRYTPPDYMVKKPFSVDLNIADSFDLQEIYGIGPAFAKRIIRYRKDLGGYVNLAQLREVWGIDSSVFDRIIPHLYIQDTNIRKININEADIRTLRQHPYIDYYQAKEIYLHRQKYGRFRQVTELKKVNLIDSGTYSRIAPYLCTD